MIRKLLAIIGLCLSFIITLAMFTLGLEKDIKLQIILYHFLGATYVCFGIIAVFGLLFLIHLCLKILEQ